MKYIRQELIKILAEGVIAINVVKITFASEGVGGRLISGKTFYRICGENDAGGTNEPSSRIIHAITLRYDGI